MPQVEKNKNKKTQGFFAGIWHSLSFSSSESSNGMTCTDDQCFIGSPHSSDAASFSMPQNIIAESSNESSLIHFLPEDLYSAMQEAAKKGFLYSFLNVLTEEYVADLMRTRHYTPKQIQWANQAIRALTFIALGASMSKTLMTPMANYLLTSNYVGLNQRQAGYLTTATLMATDLFMNPSSLAIKTLGYSASIVGSIGGSQLARFSYQKGSQLIQNSLFAPKSTINWQEKPREMQYSPKTSPKI